MTHGTGIIATLAVLTALTFTAPAPAAADDGDCGGQYFQCLSDSGALGTSDAVHETECYGDYLACLGEALVAY